jgi:ribosomal-protein-alanine N-acetyltransferase
MYSEIIETERLILKGLSPGNISYIFEQFPKAKIKELLGHETEEAYLTEEKKNRNGYASYNRTFILFLLIDKSYNTIIGRCGIHNWNIEHRRAEIGYNITHETFKRKGLMSEAVATIIEYGFTKLNLNRLEAIVGSSNTPSLKIMEKFGFIQEGIMRQHYPANNGFEDSILFSKLQEAYKK